MTDDPARCGETRHIYIDGECSCPEHEAYRTQPTAQEECKHGIDGPDCDIHGYGKPTAQEAEREDRGEATCVCRKMHVFARAGVRAPSCPIHATQTQHICAYSDKECSCFEAGRERGRAEEREAWQEVGDVARVLTENRTLRAENARLREARDAGESLLDTAQCQVSSLRDMLAAAEQREKRLRNQAWNALHLIGLRHHNTGPFVRHCKDFAICGDRVCADVRGDMAALVEKP